MKHQEQDIKNLKRMLEFLEKTDLSKETLDSIITKISSLNGYLSYFEINKESELFQRLERFTDLADSYFSEKNKKDYCTESYIGVSGKYKLFYNYIGDHAFLGRWYYEPDSNGRIKLDWRFNLEGKIDFVDSRLYPEGKICHLMGNTERKEMPPLWQKGLFWYNRNLPERMSLIAQDFFSKSFFKTYSSLLRFGHSTIRKLVEDLKKGNILDSYEIREGQKHLRELINNKNALRILEKSALLQPRINQESGDYLVVEYEDYRE